MVFRAIEVWRPTLKHSEASISTSASASATSSREGTKWQGAAITGFPLTSYMGNAVCCAWNACHDVQRRGPCGEASRKAGCRSSARPGLMSGDGKRSVGHRPQATAPIFDSTEAAYQKSRCGKEKRAFRVVSWCRAGTAAYPPAAGTLRNRPDVCSRPFAEIPLGSFPDLDDFGGARCGLFKGGLLCRREALGIMTGRLLAKQECGGLWHLCA